MGGYGRDNDFSNDDMQRLKKAAEERLETLLGQSTKILFACEAKDRRSLESHLARSKVIQKEKSLLIDSSEGGNAVSILKSASIVVLFTNETTTTEFLDKLIDEALVQMKTGFHVAVRDGALIPRKVTAYRWRSVSWEQLESFFGS